MDWTSNDLPTVWNTFPIHKIWNLSEAQIEQGVCHVYISFESATIRWFLWTAYGYADPDEMARDRVVISCHSSKKKLINEGSDLNL